MKYKLILNQEEFNELQRLMSIVKNKNNLPGERRLAMAKFDQLYKQAAKRNVQQEYDGRSRLAHI